MPNKSFNTRISLKYDTAANWEAHKDLVLNVGEAAIEKNASGVFKMKVGDGTTDYEHLPYIAGSDQSVAGKEDTTNKVSDWSDTPTDTHYPSEKLVYDSLVGMSETLEEIAQGLEDVATSVETLDGNRVSSFQSTPDNTHYPSEKLVKDSIDILVTAINGLENPSNKVLSWSATPNNEHYPSEKLVKDNLDLKANSSDLATVATSGSYSDLSNKPTSLSQFTDNLGSSPVHTHSQYLTTHQDISGKEDKSNKTTSLTSSSTDTQYPSAKAVYDSLDAEATTRSEAVDGLSERVSRLESSFQYLLLRIGTDTYINPSTLQPGGRAYTTSDFANDNIGDINLKAWLKYNYDLDTAEDLDVVSVYIWDTATGTDDEWSYWRNINNPNIGSYPSLLQTGMYMNSGAATMSDFSNTVHGAIVGSQTDGYVCSAGNGKGQVYGWSSLKGKVSTNETNITNLTTRIGSDETRIDNLSTSVSGLAQLMQDAAHIYVGTTTPTSSIGQDGDIYIVT